MLKAISRFIDFITWIISFLLVARFVLRFFGARPGAPFVDWLYMVTTDLMSPFMGIFPNLSLTSGNLVDISAIVAAIVYGVVGYAFSSFIDSISDHLAYRRPAPEDQVMRSPNPVAPSVNQQPINEPVGLKNNPTTTPK